MYNNRILTSEHTYRHLKGLLMFSCQCYECGRPLGLNQSKHLSRSKTGLINFRKVMPWSIVSCFVDACLHVPHEHVLTTISAVVYLTLS